METFSHTEKLALGYLNNSRNAADQQGADWHYRAAVRNADKTGMTIEEIEAKAGRTEAATKPKAAACSVAGIRRFFAVCKGRALDTSNSDYVRGVLAGYFQQPLKSRSELSPEQWHRAADAVERGELAF